jgi:hypothetical protein
MPLIIQQNIQQLIDASSPEQKILWEQIRLLTGENAAVRKLVFAGNIAASEFETYSANKLYLCYSLIIGAVISLSGAAGYITFYKEGNAVSFYYGDNSLMYDAGAAAGRYGHNSFQINNFYFTRIVRQQYTQIVFNGFRIDY